MKAILREIIENSSFGVFYLVVMTLCIVQLFYNPLDLSAVHSDRVGGLVLLVMFMSTLFYFIPIIHIASLRVIAEYKEAMVKKYGV